MNYNYIICQIELYPINHDLYTVLFYHNFATKSSDKINFQQNVATFSEINERNLKILKKLLVFFALKI